MADTGAQRAQHLIARKRAYAKQRLNAASAAAALPASAKRRRKISSAKARSLVGVWRKHRG